MEDCLYLAYSKGSGSLWSRRLSPHIYNSDSHKMHGENSCPPIPIPIIQIPTIHFNFQWPIRLQTNWFNCGSVDLHPT